MIIIAKKYLPNKKLYNKYIDEIYAYVWVQVCLTFHFQKNIV